MRYPSPESLPRLGLCSVCLDAPAANAMPAPQWIELGTYSDSGSLSSLPAFTESEIDEALLPLMEA